ncbi:hypothetical protein TIFTF001_002782 [Ficus carica]|uniref:Uncharacterized protein n=1 Tax=Ficus carica TaxID=3494 RepID=A0AA87Z7P5_FICCA|nr:hypothetical protein TIFTF001_002782 [Ficus carica]
MFSNLAAKFAFFPPTPATYAVKRREGDGKLTAVSVASTKTTALAAAGCSVPLAEDNALDVVMIETKQGNKIVGFYLKNPYARLTLLYSHGNAADLGQLYDLFLQLKVNLRVNLMGELNTYADIEAVYECLQTQYGVSQEDLILYGQSVGSGPTLHLAAKLPRLRGVVLHSAILSGLRVLCHVKFTFCFDIYKNINKIKKVKCPVLVIHVSTFTLVYPNFRCRKNAIQASAPSGWLGSLTMSGPHLADTTRMTCKLIDLLFVNIISLNQVVELTRLGLESWQVARSASLFIPVLHDSQTLSQGRVVDVGNGLPPMGPTHGTEDDVVNWLHGDGLWKMAKDPYEPLWIKGGGHCNLELYPDYIRHLCRFIHEMESITTEIRLKKIRQNLENAAGDLNARHARARHTRARHARARHARARNARGPAAAAFHVFNGDAAAAAVENVVVGQGRAKSGTDDGGSERV